MTTFVEAGLGNALVAMVLAVVALAAGLVCRRPAVIHALWLLVLIKLVTPPLVSVSVPWPREAAPLREAPRLSVEVEETPPEFAERPSPDQPFEEGLDELPPPDDIEPPEASPTPEIPDVAPPWRSVFGLAWLAGSLTWFAVAARRVWGFARLLRHARPASGELTERVAHLSRTLGLREPPRVLLVQGHLSPMVWALGRVSLLVPAKLVSRMSAPALATVLAHELAHIRRRDHWVRWLELAGLGLYWWNPVVWLARRELRQAEELCCDAWVVRFLPEARRVYATALVDALDFLSRPDEPVPALGCGLGRVDDLKRRLTMILRGQTSPRLDRTTALGVFGLALLLLPLVPGLSQAQPSAESPKPARPGFDQLDPESRARLEAEVRALIEKRLAEAKDRAEKATREQNTPKPGERTKEFPQAEPDRRRLQALQADIEAKIAALRLLESRQNPQKGPDPFRKPEWKPDRPQPLQVEMARQEMQLRELERRLPEAPKESDEMRELQRRYEETQKGLEALRSKLIDQKRRSAHAAHGLTILIEVQGVKDPNAVRTLAERIKEAVGEKQNGLTIKIIRSGAGDPSQLQKPSAAPAADPRKVTPDAGKLAPQALLGGGRFIVPVKPTTDISDRRIDMLEKKLDAVLREFEALRQSRELPNKGKTKGAAGTKPTPADRNAPSDKRTKPQEP